LLGEADGMRSRECDTGSPAGWRSHDGRLWFPTVQGIAVLDPRSFGSQLPLPPVIIESAGLDEAVQERTAGRLVVPAHTQKLEFHYAGLSLASPERIRFRYRLQGFDRGWVEAGNRRTAYYTNLPPGDYTFQVVASNGDAMWTPEGATLRVTVLPHFYQTVWFYGLCLAGFWLALWIVGQRYASKLRHREHELRVVKKALEEKHGAEAALRDSEERFRKLAAGTSTETGEAFFRSLVLHASEALGVTYTFVAELKPGAPEVARTLAACKNGEIIPNFEYDLRSTPCENVVGRQLCHYPAQVSQVFPDDHLLAEMGVDAYMGTPLFGASGEALGLFVALNEKPIPNPELAQSILQICAARAATELERIRAEMALRTSEETFSRTFKQSPNTMILATLEEGRCLDINDAGIKLFGAPREEVIGKTGTDLNIWAHPEERARFRRDLAEFGRVADREMLFRSRPGALRTLIINADVIRVKGTPWMLVTARDITDEKTAQEALLASEAKYRDLFENANDVIFTTDPGGRFLSINRAGQALCGLSPAESLQAKMVELLDKPSVEIYAKSMAELLAGRRSATCEVTLCREGAGSRILELALRPIVEEGAVVAIQGIGRDVTERRLLEKKLLQAQKMEAIGTLAGGIAHDFNNLLTVITGYTQLAKDRAGKKGKIGDDLEEIQQATRRATSLTSQLLSFSRSQVAQQSVVNLNDAVNGMWKMLQRLIGEDLKLETKLDPGLASIWADPAQIDQVILNLAANARDAMPSGGTLRFVTAMLRLRVPDSGRNLLAGEYAVLTVTDTGCGMDPATVSRVFEPFFTTKEVGKGTGLGLSTVYAIVQQAGGQISVASSPGRGTTFSLYFPAADREGVSRRKERVEHAARGSETILLVEDDSALRALSTRILHDAGYTVFAASGVEDAACMMQELSTRVDLVITDVVMPDGGGMELVSRVTKTRPGVRVLFMSGYTDGKVPQEYLSGKHPSFLAKPFRPEDLARKVRQVLDSERPLATHPRS
ncbi:MAG TPA: PAS domain S-box protein, partial [Terriglobales bacterium]|nr:PAS domain S-box protein [Terriglobales bacterium]